MSNYKLVKNPEDGSINAVEHIIKTKTYTVDGKTVTSIEKEIIPFAEGNKDYQEYLEWAKTNTPDPADEVGTFFE